MYGKVEYHPTAVFTVEIVFNVEGGHVTELISCGVGGMSSEIVFDSNMRVLAVRSKGLFGNITIPEKEMQERVVLADQYIRQFKDEHLNV